MPNNAVNRQITEAKEKALAPLWARVAERIAHERAERQRDGVQRQRERVLSAISWRLPRGISDDEKKRHCRDRPSPRDELSADASERDMQRARDGVIQEYEGAYKEKARRAEKKAAQARNKANLVQYGLSQIRPYAERLLRQFDYDPGETVWNIDSRAKSGVRKALEEELNGTETEQEVGRIVRQVMREIEGCD